MSLQKKVLDFSNRHQLIDDGSFVLVGVSGGPDSMCLLDILRSLSESKSLELGVLHVNYGLRGDDADMDEKLVIDYANQYNLTCFSANAKEIVTQQSSEADLRSIRYAFYEECVDQIGAACVALAHTLSDQAETVLLNLLRGSGMQGMRGMRPKRDLYVRPLLKSRREDVMQYLKDNNVPYRIDKTNQETVFTRNKVRINLLPKLKEFNPKIETALWNLSQSAQRDYTFIESYTKKQKLIETTQEGFVASKKKLQKEDPAVQVAALRGVCEQILPDGEQLSKSNIDQILGLINSTKNKHKSFISNHLIVTLKGDTLSLQSAAGTQPPADDLV